MKNRTKILGAIAVALCMTTSAISVQAKTFRFAFQGDVASMDPYALAENFSSSFHSNVYEPLEIGRASCRERV